MCATGVRLALIESDTANGIRLKRCNHRVVEDGGNPRALRGVGRRRIFVVVRQGSRESSTPWAGQGKRGALATDGHHLKRKVGIPNSAISSGVEHTYGNQIALGVKQ